MVKKLDPKIYVIAGVITTFVFIVGILLGFFINSFQVSHLANLVSSLESSVKNVELEFLFFDVTDSEISCNYFGTEAARLGKLAENLGLQVSAYEENRQIGETSYTSLKTKYTLVLIQEWLFLEKIKKTCPDVNYVTVLYFYTQNPDKETERNQQAFILDYYKNLLGPQMMVFALDTSLNISIVNAMQNTYQIDEKPSVVIGDKSYYLLSNTTKFEEILCQNIPTLSLCES